MLRLGSLACTTVLLVLPAPAAAQGLPPPGAAPPGTIPEGPPPAAAPSPPRPLRWSLRFDPFDLIMRRLTFHAEVGVAGPFAVEVVPSWVWSSPLQGIEEEGFSIAGNAVFYLSGQAFRGMWLKAHFAYENYSAVVSDPAGEQFSSEPKRFGSAVLGVLFGDTWVIPRSGGFVLSGGIGVGVTTAPKAEITSTSPSPVTATLYDGFDRVRLLGTLGLGVCF